MQKERIILHIPYALKKQNKNNSVYTQIFTFINQSVVFYEQKQMTIQKQQLVAWSKKKKKKEKNKAATWEDVVWLDT